MRLQEEVISTCTNYISRHQQVALEGSKHRWQATSSALRSRYPYCFNNFRQALSRFNGYVSSIRECGVNWLGLKFKFPLIWWPAKPYNMDFSLARAEEQRCWKYWVTHRGFLKEDEVPEFPYNFSSLHEHSSAQDSDSEWCRLLHEDMQQDSWGEMLSLGIAPFWPSSITFSSPVLHHLAC